MLGVLLDDYRRALEYWFTRDELDPRHPLSRVGDMERYPARAADGRPLVWHICDAARTSQTRGVTAFAPVFELLGQFDDLQFAAVVKALVSNCFTFIREQPLSAPGGKRGQLGPQTTESMADGESRLVEDLSPGLEITGRPGEKITAFSPNVPNAEFFEHVRFVLQLVCTCVNLPLISLLLDGRETNFSGWRGAIDQARIGWKRSQGLFARMFHLPAYRHRLWCRTRAEAPIARAMERLGSAFYRCRITRPRWPYIQPVHDITAGKLEVETLQISPRRQALERGLDFEELTAEIVADNARRIVDAYRAKQTTERLIADELELTVNLDPAQFLVIDPKRSLVLPGSGGQTAPPVKTDGATLARGNGKPEGGKAKAAEPATNAGGSNRDQIDTYGIGVRAGAITPQPEDEDHFRDRLGIPKADERTQEMWRKTGRKPITWQPTDGETEADSEGGDEEAATEAAGSVDSDNGNGTVGAGGGSRRLTDGE